mgnify:CR=1 FL=1
MPDTQLTWSDTGNLLDKLDELSQALENLGILDGSVTLTSTGDVFGTFTIDGNTLHADILRDGRRKTVDYER